MRKEETGIGDSGSRYVTRGAAGAVMAHSLPSRTFLPPFSRVVGNMFAQGHGTIKEGLVHLDQPQGPKIEGEGMEESSELETFFHKNAVKPHASVIEANVGEIKDSDCF